MSLKYSWIMLLGLWTSVAGAHSASNAFINLSVSGATISGTLELAIRDAEMAVGLDSNADARVTWQELRAQQAPLEAYIQSSLLIAAAAPCPLVFDALMVNERVDGNYLWLPFTTECHSTAEAEPLNQLQIDYRLLADMDTSHRGLLTLTAAGITQTAVLGAQGVQVLSLRQPSRWNAFVQYLNSGVWHIWSGIDHLLFLLSLLLPAVLLRKHHQWQPVPLARPAVINIIKVVTAFTLAHSITLSLAAFNVIRLPSHLIESIIAASIIVAALNNIFPKVTEGRWRIAFLFGLLHGFGFASVLADMGLPSGARVLSLLAFNLGVELGQLAVVLAVMPLAYAIRASTFYRRGVMPWGSSAIGALALVWLVQRASG